jgi:AhpD family alkylhydroperoxidase
VTFPERHAHLQQLVTELGREASGPMSGFARLHASSVTDGELESKVKELMALAIAIAIRCEDCIAYHVHDALAAGASRKEIAETIGVAVMMGGGPAAVYGAQALEAVGQFESAAAGTTG